MLCCVSQPPLVDGCSSPLARAVLGGHSKGIDSYFVRQRLYDRYIFPIFPPFLFPLSITYVTHWFDLHVTYIRSTLLPIYHCNNRARIFSFMFSTFHHFDKEIFLRFVWAINHPYARSLTEVMQWYQYVPILIDLLVVVYYVCLFVIIVADDEVLEITVRSNFGAIFENHN